MHYMPLGASHSRICAIRRRRLCGYKRGRHCILMSFLRRYRNLKPRVLADESICPENRAIITQFCEFLEYKLKRSNGLPDLDDACGQTLYGYLLRLKNVNLWFGNKPWKDLTKEDIKRVYDGLEDGTIRTRRGTPFAGRRDYYNKIFRGKP